MIQTRKIIVWLNSTNPQTNFKFCKYEESNVYIVWLFYFYFALSVFVCHGKTVITCWQEYWKAYIEMWSKWYNRFTKIHWKEISKFVSESRNLNVCIWSEINTFLKPCFPRLPRICNFFSRKYAGVPHF